MLRKLFSIHYGRSAANADPVNITEDIEVKGMYMSVVSFNTEAMESAKYNTAKPILEAIQDKIRELKDIEIAIDLRNISRIAFKDDPVYTINQKIACQNLINLILYATVSVPKFPRNFIFHEPNQTVLAKIEQFKQQFKNRANLELFYDQDLPTGYQQAGSNDQTISA